MVTDNGANIVKAVTDPEDKGGCNWRHIPCFAHTLSLAVKDAIHSNNDFAGKKKKIFLIHELFA